MTQKTNAELVAAAYDVAKEQILRTLQTRINERTRWEQNADDETRAFWLKMRERGIPDRIAERDAYQLLADHIATNREIT
jgi:hypothetical protein